MSYSKSHGLLASVFVAAAVLALLAPAVSAEELNPRREYSAFGVFTQGGGTENLEIIITRWSTDEERSLLVNTLAKKGQDATIAILRKQPETGFLRRRDGRQIEGLPSVRLHYAREFKIEDGKRVVVAVTERPIGAGTAQVTSVVGGTNLSVIQMNLEAQDGQQKGSGIIYRAVKMGYDEDKKKLKFEGQSLEPLRLTRITRRK